MSQNFHRMHGAVCTLLFGAALGLITGANAAVPNPIVTGPIAQPAAPGDPSHNYIFFTSNHELPARGYIEEEFFIEGAATRYATPNQTNPDASSTGTVISTGNPFRTRMVVRRPVDPSKFNGTVLVEWYNVTNNFDAENTWFFAWEHMMRAGYVWVGVSAQRVGVNALKVWSPTRYGTFDVTAGGTVNDDSLSYDIFSQAGQAIRQPGTIDVLHGLIPQQVVAIGESQSAQRLAAYANSIQPLANIYDGIVYLSTIGQRVRQDLDIPLFKVLTEFDVLGASEASVRQPDTDGFRTWEVAATSHVDQHLRDSREPLELRDNGVSSEHVGLDGICTFQPVGTRVPTTYVLASALDKMVTWIRTGTPPPTAPRIQTITNTTAVRNSLGIAQGGIQLAQAVVPYRINVGLNSGPGACVRWGYSVPIATTQLQSMYASRIDFYSAFVRTSKANFLAGYMLLLDVVHDAAEAASADIGR
jgi:hypothetical protein